jgi:hypothetical protein
VKAATDARGGGGAYMNGALECVIALQSHDQRAQVQQDTENSTETVRGAKVTLLVPLPHKREPRPPPSCTCRNIDYFDRMHSTHASMTLRAKTAWRETCKLVGSGVGLRQGQAIL